MAMGDDSGLLPRWLLAKSASCDRRLSRTDLAVLMVILDAINSDPNHAGYRTAWTGFKCIAERSKADRSSVVRSVGRLVELGYLLRESGNRTTPNSYRIGRCEVAPSCELTPRRGSTPSGRCELAPEVGAKLSLGVGANSRPDLAYKKPPIDTTQLILPTCDRFADFWKAYPRKEAKAKAAQVWKSKRLDKIADQILADVIARNADARQWTDRQYIPLPTTYLNERRFEDEWKPAPGKAAAPRTNDDFRSTVYVGSPMEDILESLRPAANE